MKAFDVCIDHSERDAHSKIAFKHYLQTMGFRCRKTPDVWSRGSLLVRKRYQ